MLKTLMQRLQWQKCIKFNYNRSAIKQKYFKDEFSEEFVKGTSKKDVLIHRGYWCRFNIFHRIVSTYVSK